MSLPQAPDGQIFYSYAKAQEHWEGQGQIPIRQPFTDASKSSRRVARLPEGWEVKAIQRDDGKVCPACWLHCLITPHSIILPTCCACHNTGNCVHRAYPFGLSQHSCSLLINNDKHAMLKHTVSWLHALLAYNDVWASPEMSR